MAARRLLLALGLLATCLAHGSPTAVADEPAPDPVPHVGDATIFRTDQGSINVADSVRGSDGAWWGLRQDERIVRIDAAEEVEVFDIDLAYGRWLVVGPDDALWAFGPSANVYARVTLDGVSTSGPDPIDGTLLDVAAHPDGTIWLLTSTQIVRLATDGTVAGTLPVPAGARALAVTPAGDALVLLGGALLRFEPDGETQTVPFSGIGDPEDIVVRPDGVVVVTDDAGDDLVEVAPDGSTARVELGLGRLADLVLGGDDDVWVIGDGLRRVSPSHVVSTVTLPYLADQIGSSLTQGPGGEMWGSAWYRLFEVSPDLTVDTLILGTAAPFTGTAGPDGEAWIGGYQDGHVARVDADGTVRPFASISYAYFGMTVGPDGNVWATNNDLARITPSGEVTQFWMTEMGHVWDVAVGPDDALWVIDREGSVGRVGLDGTTTAVFPLPQGLGEPFHIVAAGGYLWVSLSRTSTLARVSASGDMTLYPVPAVGAVADVTVGPDGNLWLTHGDRSVIRFALDGTTTTFPTPGLVPTGITSAPDGNLWVSGVGDEGGAMGQLSPDGDLAIFPAPGLGRPIHIFSTADGFVWVPGGCCIAAHDGHSIARIAVGVVDVDLTLAEDEVAAHQRFDAVVTVTNNGPAELTGVELSGDLAACNGALADLGPGESNTINCGVAFGDPGTAEPMVTVDTAETQPKTASDQVTITPVTCLGQIVTVDLANGDHLTAGADVVLGTPEADTISTLGGDDVICPGRGDDIVSAGRGDDRVLGGPGRDTLDGGIGNDVVRGGDQADVVSGGPGVDLLDGGDGVDTIRGGPQADRLIGGPKRDTCAGGGGTDRAVTCEIVVGVP
jgi:virginiamycin B lyase